MITISSSNQWQYCEFIQRSLNPMVSQITFRSQIAWRAKTILFTKITELEASAQGALSPQIYSSLFPQSQGDRKCIHVYLSFVILGHHPYTNHVMQCKFFKCFSLKSNICQLIQFPQHLLPPEATLPAIAEHQAFQKVHPISASSYFITEFRSSLESATIFFFLRLCSTRGRQLVCEKS